MTPADLLAQLRDDVATGRVRSKSVEWRRRYDAIRRLTRDREAEALRKRLARAAVNDARTAALRERPPSIFTQHVVRNGKITKPAHTEAAKASERAACSRVATQILGDECREFVMRGPWRVRCLCTGDHERHVFRETV